MAVPRIPSSPGTYPIRVDTNGPTSVAVDQRIPRLGRTRTLAAQAGIEPVRCGLSEVHDIRRLDLRFAAGDGVVSITPPQRATVYLTVAALSSGQASDEPGCSCGSTRNVKWSSSRSESSPSGG